MRIGRGVFDHSRNLIDRFQTFWKRDHFVQRIFLSEDPFCHCLCQDNGTGTTKGASRTLNEGECQHIKDGTVCTDEPVASNNILAVADRSLSMMLDPGEASDFGKFCF